MPRAIGVGIGIPFGSGRIRPPFDALSVSAASAYGLRRLRTAYSGQAIRVRRSNDNAEADIGFSGNDLDTAALLSHCGANSGFIVTWYDQSTNARNATQSTAANQPRIVNAGVVETKNGRPTIRAHINTTMLPLWKFAAPSTAWSFNAVASRDNTGANNNDILCIDGGGFNANGIYTQIADFSTRTVFNTSGSNVVVTGGAVTIAAGQNVINTLTHTSGNVAQTSTNGSPGSASAPITWTSGVHSNFRLGEYTGSTSFSLLGTYQEVFSFAVDLTATDRIALERNQGAYFGIGVA